MGLIRKPRLRYASLFKAFIILCPPYLLPCPPDTREKIWQVRFFKQRVECYLVCPLVVDGGPQQQITTSPAASCGHSSMLTVDGFEVTSLVRAPGPCRPRRVKARQIVDFSHLYNLCSALSR